jgi:hypothetical protein
MGSKATLLAGLFSYGPLPAFYTALGHDTSTGTAHRPRRGLSHGPSQASFSKGGAPAFSGVRQPPGWQCLLHAALLDGDVASLALAPAQRLLAAGDAKGRVVVLDLAKVTITSGTVQDSLSPVACHAGAGCCKCVPVLQCLPLAMQPAGLWAADLGAGPIAALALGMHLVPPSHRRSSNNSGGSGSSSGETR